MNTYINAITSLIPYPPSNVEIYCYRSDFFFNPNICHLCKCALIYQSSVPCICNMIFYCTQDHKKEHSEEHNFFCQHLQEILKNEKVDHTEQSVKEYIQSRHTFLSTIRARIPEYKIKQYEEEMIMFTKSCFECHRKSKDLKTCSVCYSVNYCSFHENNFKIYHQSKCKTLLLCLNAQIIHCSFSYNRKFENFYINVCTFPVNMVNFVLNHIRLIEYKESEHSIQQSNSYQEEIIAMTGEELCYSEYVSDVLTLYNMMMIYRLAIDEKLQRMKSVIILHVINFNVKHLLSWELLLHGTSIHQLTIVLIGREDFKINRHYYTLCTRCKEKSRIIKFRYFPRSYRDYIDDPSYLKPDIIIAFQEDFNDQGTLPTSILDSELKYSPWIFTVKSMAKACCITQNIRNKFKSIRPSYFEKNVFRSLMPSRDLENIYFYRNEYVIFYQYLSQSNN